MTIVRPPVRFTRTLCCILAAVIAIGGIATSAEPHEERLAGEILRQAGTTKGLCLDLGCGDGKLALELARQSEMFVQALTRHDSTLNTARKTLDVDGLYGRRVAAEKGNLERLPYPDYCANLVVRGDLLRAGFHKWSWKEVLRVLRPGGLAYIGQTARPAVAEPLTGAQLRKMLTEAGVKQFEVIEKDGVWAKFRRPWPKGIGHWSHDGRCSPANNPCVEDDLVRAPFHTLWIAGPRNFTKFGYPLISNGRVFLRHGGITHTGRWSPPKQPDLVQAFDAYNGVMLWQRRLPERLGNGFVAVGDEVYAVAGQTLYALDAATGQTRWKLSPDAVEKGMKDWGYYACANGVLVVGLFDAVRDPKAKRDGRSKKVLAGLLPEHGNVLWRIQPATGVGSVAMAAGRVFYSGPGKYLAALDVQTGKELWNAPVKAGGIRYHKGKLYTSGGVFSAADGKLLGRNRARGIFIGDHVYSGSLKGISVTDLKTGKRIAGLKASRDPFCPKTGIPDGCRWMYGRCIRRTASTHCFFFSYSGTAIGDLIRGEVFPAEAFRSNCRTGVIAGNGLVYSSPSGCACAFPVRGGVALVPVDEDLYWARPKSNPPAQLQKGPAYDAAASNPQSTTRNPQSEWPCYRGNAERNNITPASLTMPIKLQWKKQVAGTITPPSAAAGMVFAGSDNHSVYGLDAGSGQVRWRYVTGGEIWVTPAYWQGRVYVGSMDGWVYCLRADSGALIWRFRGAPLDRKMMYFGRPRSLWPVAGGVIVQDGVVNFYAGHCSHDRVFVYALDAKTGKVIWVNDKSGQAYKVTGMAGGLSPHGVSPSGPIAASKEVLYIPHGMFAPAAMRRSDGKILWWGRRGNSTQRSSIEVQHIGGPELALGGGFLFCGGPNRVTATWQRFVAVDAGTGRFWGQDDPRLAKRAGRDPKTGEATMITSARWGTKPITFGEGVAPVVIDGGVFTLGYRGGFFDLKKHLQTQFGKPKGPTNKWPGRLPGSTLIVAGDKVIVAGGKDLFALARAGGRQLWRGKTGAQGDVQGNGLAAAGGRLFAATSKGELVCFSADR